MGWTSLLLEQHASTGASDPFDVPSTPDQTVVLALRRDHDLDILRRGRWNATVQRAGAVGTNASSETCRLRWRARDRRGEFETVHLYIPSEALAETAEALRRAARPPRLDRLSTLSHRDETIRAGIARLLAAGRQGAPDLYAASARQWLVANLLVPDGVDHSRHDVAAPPDADRRIARAAEALAASIEATPSLDWLAAEAGVSKFHLVRLFRRRMGRTPWQFLLDLRMERARDLLAGGDLPIASIAACCGYPRANNFATAFVRRHGRSPHDFRAATRR